MYVISIIILLIIVWAMLNANAKSNKNEEDILQNLNNEDNELTDLIDKIEENNEPHEKSSISLQYEDNVVINNVIDSAIPSNIEEITNNQYEVLKRLNGVSIKYALTGIINTYHSNLPELLKKFKELELLRYSNLEEAISKMTIKELKEYLRDKKLKLIGNKKDLINRLLPELSEEEQKRILIKNKCYVLTEKGNQILEKYERVKENEEQSLFKQAINLFKTKQIQQAYEKICEYNVKYNNVSGLNFDWKEQLKKGIDNVDYKVINWFMSKELNLNSEILESDFKAIICFEYLSGKSYSDTRKLIKNVYNYSEDVLNIQYYNSIISNEREALSLEDLDMQYYEILDTNDSCSKCKNKAHKKLKLSERRIGVNFPPLCKECKCTIVAYFDEDA